MINKTLLILLMLVYSSINSQIFIDFIDKSETKNFKEIVTKVEAFYADKDKGRGSGYKQFKRWEHHNATRLSEDGKIVDLVSTNFNEFYYYQENYSNNSNSNLAAKTLNGNNSVSGNWEAVGPTKYTRIVSGHGGGLGRVNTIEFDPTSNERYLGTPAGGLWRQSNIGLEALTDGMPTLGVSGIAIDYSSPENNRTIYILTGDGDAGHTPGIGVLKSTDHGNTWYSTGLTGTDIGERGYKLKIHPSNPNILFAVGSNGILKTTDGGLSWTDKTTIGIVYDIEFKPNDPTIMYASTRSRIYKSINSGDSWSATSLTIVDTPTRIELAVTTANENYVYAICGGGVFFDSAPGNYGFNGVYRSEDSGDTFTLRSNTPNLLSISHEGQSTFFTNFQDSFDQSRYDLAITISPTNADDIYIGAVNTWKSNDGGVNWTKTSHWDESLTDDNYTHADIHDMKFDNGNLYCASDGGLYEGTINTTGVAWTDLSQVDTNGLQISQVYRLGLGVASSDTESFLYFGSQDNGLNALKSADSNEALHWEGADGFETVVLSNSSYVVGASQFGNLHLMTNERLINHPVFSALTPFEKGAWLTPLVSINNGGTNPNNTLYVGYQDLFHQTTPNGVAPERSGWENISNGKMDDDDDDDDPEAKADCIHIAVAPSNNNIIYVSKSTNDIFRTTDHGENWTKITNNLPSGEQSYFVVHPINANIVYTVVGGFSDGNKVFRTINGGVSWTNISGSLPNVPINCIVHDESDTNGLYVGMDIGIFYIDDNLSDWIPFYNDLPNVGINELEIDHETNDIYAATWGRGIWKSSLYGKYCQSSANLEENLEGFKYITANDISSNSIVEPFAEVGFAASNSIVLTDGFTAVPNDGEFLFYAEIDDDVCSQGTSAKSIKSKTGVYAGPLPGVIGLQENDIQSSVAQINNYLYIFPNPSDTYIYMQFKLNNPSEISINLFDMKGSNILSEKRLIEYSGTVVEKLKSTNIQTGQYILEIIYDGYRETKKVIIQH